MDKFPVLKCRYCGNRMRKKGEACAACTPKLVRESQAPVTLESLATWWRTKPNG